MENLRQVVIQLTSSTEVRSIAQYGNDFIPEKQIIVKYEDLNESEKETWDSFIDMIKTKE